MNCRSVVGNWLLFCAAAALINGLPVRAEVKLPAVLAEHMVLQRDLPVHLWGKAEPGERVSATFRGATSETIANEFGQWELRLPSGAAGGPFTLEIHGKNEIRFTDVLVGDVWLASGQSNMEFETRKAVNAEAELKSADRPRIRLFHVERASANYAKDDLIARPWSEATPETVSNFSAVAYFFAREIQDDQKVPIGLIESDWGGSPAEAWTSLRAMGADPSLIPVFAAHGEMTDKESQKLLEDVWEKQQIEAALAAGKPKPDFPWHPELRSWEPAGLYNAMIAPLTGYPVRGFLWYQGESNTAKTRYAYYERLFETMIEDWRSRWGEGEVPFLFVQLANFVDHTNVMWPEIRDAQRRALVLRNTGMAVAIDIGNPTDVHPTNKQEVGLRLALAARAIAYGEKIEYSGPLFRSAVPEGDSLRVFFDHADSGLVTRGDTLRGFEIAGADGKYVGAEARIDGTEVVLKSEKVAAPQFVRYGASMNPDCNLYNKAGLPAATFNANR